MPTRAVPLTPIVVTPVISPPWRGRPIERALPLRVKTGQRRYGMQRQDIHWRHSRAMPARYMPLPGHLGIIVLSPAARIKLSICGMLRQVCLSAYIAVILIMYTRCPGRPMDSTSPQPAPIELCVCGMLTQGTHLRSIEVIVTMYTRYP